MLSKSLLCASLLFLAPFANAGTFTPPSTKCSTIGTNSNDHRHSRTYTRVASCTNTVPKARTTSTTTTTTPVSTSTVVTTSTFTDPTSTSTATDTIFSTSTVNSTSVTTVTSTSSTSTVTTVTSYYPTTAANAPGKRAIDALEPRATTQGDIKTRTPPPPGVVCVINRCTRTRVTTTSTITDVASESTTTYTSQFNSTITPGASTTVNSTSVVFSTSTITSTDTKTTVSTSTSTVYYTATPTFYIQSNGNNPSVGDGTDLTNVPDSTNGEGTGIYQGAGTLFMLDPSTGQVYSTSNQYGAEYLNTIAGNTYSPTFFDDVFLLEDYGAGPGGAAVATCTINNSTLELQCNGNSNSAANLFQTVGNALYLNVQGGPRGYYNDNPTVDIINQQ